MLLAASLLLLAGPRPCAAAGAGPVLELRVAGKEKLRWSLDDLKGRLAPRRVVVASALFARGSKRYEAFALEDLLDAAYGKDWRGDDFSDVAFVASDGYESVGRLSKLREGGAYLAYRDLDQASGWEHVSKEKADPGPFFLVWTGADQTMEKEYPWPWGVVAINLLRFEDQYPAVVPRGAAKGSAEYRGFLLFRGRCLRCHAMDRQGGKLGPDFNAPRNITTYRSKREILELTREPSKFRYGRMPDHPDLSDGDLESLYRYLKFMAR